MLKLSWLISLGISLIGFLIIEHFFTIQPEGVSGSGNLGAVGITFVLPFLLLSLLTTFRYVLSLCRNNHQLNKIIIIVSGFILMGIFIYFSIDYKNDVINSLGGSVSDPDSQIYGFPLLNQYTNHIFFNFYTFVFVHTISGTIGAIVGVIKPKKGEELPQ